MRTQSRGWETKFVVSLAALFGIVPAIRAQSLLEIVRPQVVPSVRTSALKQPNFGALLAESNRAFMENRGQWPSEARFHARYPGLDLWVTKTGWKLDRFTVSSGGELKGHVVNVRFVGGNKSPKIAGNGVRNTLTDFLIGRKRVRSVRKYDEVWMKDVYPGSDVRWHLDGVHPRFDVVVRPGAKPSNVRMRFEGAEGLRVDSAGDLVVRTSTGSIEHKGLFAYQMVGEKRVPVDVSFKLLDASTVGFEVGAYDKSRALVIDPLVYGSYYGGDSGFDEVHAVVADADFGVFVTGYTEAPDFPAIAGPYGFALRGVRDAFVSKFQGDAYNHDYSAYIGGDGSDVGQYIGLSPDGQKIWVAGTTTSANFPDASGGFQSTIRGGSDIFLLRLSKDDVTVLDPDYSTYYGTTGSETLRGMVVSPVTGDVVVSGETSGGLSNTNNAYLGGVRDAFFTRFSTDASGITGIAHSYYVGGTGTDSCTGAVVDSNDNVLIGGTVSFSGVVDTSINPAPFMTTPGVFANGRLLRETDVFVRKYSGSGAIVYSALLGGNGDDTAAVGGVYTGSPLATTSGIAVDPAGNVYLTGIARSFNFPRTRDVFGENFSASPVVFVTKINQDGSEIVYSTNLQTTGPVNPSGIAVDSRGIAYVTGVVGFTLPSFNNGDPNEPASVSFGSIPTTEDALDPDYTSPTPPELPTTEGFVLALTPTATNLLYGSYVGDMLDEQVYPPYVDRFGDVWIVGGVDVFRQYLRVSSTGTITIYTTTASLPGSLLSPFAFKTSTDPFGNTAVNTPYGILNSPFTAPQFITTTNRRDGFLIKKRLSLPTVTDVVLAPPNVAGGLGATSTGTITFSGPMPAGGLDVVVTLDNDAASFSPAGPQDTLVINVPGGATTAQFTVFTNPVTGPTQVHIKATLEGNFQVALLTVEPWLQQLVLTPTSVVGGNNVTGRVVLWQPAIADITVDLSTDTSGLIEFPGGNTVTVPAGVTSATFTIQTHGVGPQTDVPVTASLLGVGKTEFVRLLPASLSTVTFSPNRVTSGASATGTVTLNGEAGPSFVVDLAIVGSPAGYSLVPVQLTFNQGDRSKTFTINTAVEPVNTQRTVTATRAAQGPYSAQSISGTLFVDAATLLAFTVNPATINPGQSSTGTVTINVPAGASGAPVNVTTSDPILTVNSPVSIPSGATSTSFPITAQNVAVPNDTAVTVTASRGSVSIQRTITVKASTATLSLNPPSVVGGSSSTATLTIAQPAGAGGLTFNLASSHPAAIVPPSVTVPQGATSANFTVNTVLVGSTVSATITASSGSISASAILQVRAIGVVSVVFLPPRVRGGMTVQMTITIDAPAPPVGSVVSVSNSNPLVANVPTSVTIFGGQTSRTVTVVTRRVSRTLATQVVASLGGKSASTILQVTR